MTQSNTNKPVEKSTGLYINDHVAKIMGIDKGEEVNSKKEK